MDTIRISRISLLTLLIACAPLAAQPSVDTSSVTITYTGTASPNTATVHVTNAANVTARIFPNLQADGTLANTSSGVFVQNVVATSANTASVNIGTDPNVLAAVAKRGAASYSGATLLISATNCTDCIAIALNLSITSGGTVTITYNGAPVAASGLQLFAGAGGSTSAQLALASTLPTTFTAASNVPWLTVSPSSGNLSGSQIITLSLFASGLPNGPNSAIVTVTAGGVTTNIPILFNVGTNSGLTLSPNPMNFQYAISTGSFPTGQTQFLTISGAAATATYSAFANASPAWLQVGSGGGTTVSGLPVSAQLPVSVNPAALNLQVPATYQGTVTILTSDGLTATLNTSLTISSTPTSGATSLNFNVASPGGTAPAQQVSISGSGTFSAIPLTSSCGQGWLQVSPVNGQLSSTATPLTVQVFPGNIAAGTCTGTIFLSTNGLFSNNTNSQTINITMVIGGSAGAGAVAAPASLVFNLPSGSNQAQSQTFIVNGNGTGFTAQAIGTNLNVSPTNGVTPAIVTVTVGAGSSSGSIVVTSSLGTQNVSVTVNNPAGNVITANPGSLSFIYQTGTNPTANVSINASLASIGQNLTFSVVSAPAFVSYSAPSTTTPTTIGVGINASQLSPGLNTGNLVITSNNAANPTLTIPITVLAPGATSGLTATPNPANVSGAAFGAAVTQNISISGLTGTTFTASSSSAGNWLSVGPNAGTSPATLTIIANPGSLGAGTYNGSVTVTPNNSASLNIPVVFTVGTPGSGTPTLTVSPVTVNFAYKRGGPQPAAVPVQLGSTVAGLPFGISVTGAPWLIVTPSSNLVPATLTLSLDPVVLSTLPVGQYNGGVSITVQGASVALPVTLSVAASTSVSNLTVWRPSNGTWYVNPITAAPFTQQWGLPGDIPVAGDFNRDGVLDYVVWRPSNGTWYVTLSGSGAVLTRQWGLPGDVPVAGDFDGDGIADFAVWRPSNGTWYIIPSSNPSSPIVKQWGLTGDIPVVADFDGDGKADYVVWRLFEGNWYITLSSTGATQVKQWGLPGDVPVAADYDGDGRADFAVWRPGSGTWFIVPSTSPTIATVRQWGLPGDIPVARDYDGDGKTDFAVWRPSNGTWYIIPSNNPSAPQIVQWGLSNDVPVYRRPGT